MFSFLRRRRRAAIRNQPFPQAWRRTLRRRVPYYRLLPREDQQLLEQHVQVMLAEKHFEGCAGFEVTDEVRVTIAGQASVLILKRPEDYYGGLRSILVYPETFFVTDDEADPAGVVSLDPDERAGESWDRGALILAWDEVLLSCEALGTGYNVVHHEFAHQLDFAHGVVDGAPPLDRPELAQQWGEVFSRSYAGLVRDVEGGRRTLLDEYGATDPAEFFAVATETFFDLPVAFQRRHPDLYEVLKSYYRQDPAAVVRGARSSS